MGARAVAADLVALNTMLNWATRQRDRRGEPLVSFNRLRGVRLPREKNPKLPVETYDRFLKLMEVADGVDPRLPRALTLAESTGRRIGSILKLRRDDLHLDRLPHGWVRFVAEHDKTGREQWVPLTPYARRVALEHLRTVPGDEWLFPSPVKPSQPVDRGTMDHRLRRAYEEAREARGRSLAPVAEEVGGGAEGDAQRSDEATLTQDVLEAPKLTAQGGGRTEIAHFLPHPAGRRKRGEPVTLDLSGCYQMRPGEFESPTS